MRFVSTPFHGIVDYAAGMMLILAPLVLGFAETSHTAAWSRFSSAVAIIGDWRCYTDYEGAIFCRASSAMPVHLVADVSSGSCS